MLINDYLMKVKLLHPNAIIPTRAHESDAGLDVFTIENGVIHSGQDAIVRTGIAISIPMGWSAIVKEKSGRATKNKLTVGACVIDSGYRGEILIHMFNNGSFPVTYAIGEKIAQLVVVPVWTGNPIAVEELDETPRGEGRFGSTGLKKLDDLGMRGELEPNSWDNPELDELSKALLDGMSKSIEEIVREAHEKVASMPEWMTHGFDQCSPIGEPECKIDERLSAQQNKNGFGRSGSPFWSDPKSPISEEQIPILDQKVDERLNLCHRYGVPTATPRAILTRKLDTPEAREYWDSIDKVASQTESWSEEKKLDAQAWLNRNVRKETDKQTKPKIKFTEFSMNDCEPQCKYTQKYIKDCDCGGDGFCEFDMRDRPLICNNFGDAYMGDREEDAKRYRKMETRDDW